MKKQFFFIFLLLSLSINSFSKNTLKYADSLLYLGENGYSTKQNLNFTDLDYSKSFSFEIIIDIKSHKVNDRWCPILLKGDSRSIYGGSYKGISIGFNSGDFETFGQRIIFSISDGKTNLSKTSPFYEGLVFISATFNYSTKTINLYVNGKNVGSYRNTNIIPENIKNSFDFFLGGTNNLKLKKNIFLTRIWNRELLSNEIFDLYNMWDKAGKTEIPFNFNKSELISEWLMQEKNNFIIKDSCNNNDLELKNEAEIQIGEGILQNYLPLNNDININKSAELIASGGRENLGEDVIFPLHYRFLIDESKDFDSNKLKDSEWIKNYRCWKPILEPNTKYYWKCIVKDSNDIPIISEYTDTFSFTTEGTNNWYVRNGVYEKSIGDNLIPKPGIYGEQNGTSYENAWNGLTNVIWGEGGVEPGDNLYICGNHVYEYNSLGYFGVGKEYINESGYSIDCPITIRMDYPLENGYLYSLCKSDNLWKTEWNGPDENGVYWTDDIQYSIKAIKYSNEYKWLDKQTTTTWLNDYDHVYQIPQISAPWKTDKIYIKTRDGISPKNRVYGDIIGYNIDLGRSNFIKFYKCNFYNFKIKSDLLDNTVTNNLVSNNIIFDSCEFTNNSSIDLYQENNNWIIRNCTIHDTGYGIYTHTPGNMYNTLIENNQIYNCDTKTFPHADGHGIGVQNGVGFIIQNNHIWDTGEAICFWSGNYDMKNNIIRHNYIHDIHVSSVTGGHGISFSNNVAPGRRTGNEIYGNVLNNIGIGINDDWQGKGISIVNSDPIKIHNNTICNTIGTRGSIYLNSNNYPLKAEIFNNIIYGNNLCVYLYGSEFENWDVKIDNNLYYVLNNSKNQFYSNKSGAYFNFSEWKIKTNYDLNSIFENPNFSNTLFVNLDDFSLQKNSPAIDSGLISNLGFDINGTLIPQNIKEDIGALEYENKDLVVYVTKTGKKYHKIGCRYLKTTSTEITLKDALLDGYTQCSICKP